MALIFSISLSSPMTFAMEPYNDELASLFVMTEKKDWKYIKKHLPEYHGDINATNKDGYTLLHLAVLTEQTPYVELLIQKGANINIESTSGPVSYNTKNKVWKNRIQTPLHCAAQKGNTKIAKLLLDANATINSTYQKDGSTPLHIAAWFGRSDCVQLFITRGALIDSTNEHGSTPLHVAAWSNEPTCLSILLDNGADFLKISTTGVGNTPLYLAAKAGSLECLRILLEKYKNSGNNNLLDQKCSGNNSTALQAAGIRQHSQCYWDLVLAGADYKSPVSNENKTVSELVFENEPLKTFIKTIEWTNKEYMGMTKKLLKYDGAISPCFLCKNDYKPNDVIITVICNDSFHANCLENYAIDCFFNKTKNSPVTQNWLKETDDSISAVKKLIRTNPIAGVTWNKVDKCPQCSKTITKKVESGEQELSGTLSIYF